MTATHRLKTWPQYWDAVASGDKTFEVRRDDRGFQKGDIVELVRHNGHRIIHPTVICVIDESADHDLYDPLIRESTLRKRITYVLTGGQFGIEPGFVVLGLGQV